MPTRRGQTRVALVDAHEAVREGVTALLPSDAFQVCLSTADPERALETLAADPVDVVVLGLNLPGGEPLRLAVELRRLGIAVVGYCGGGDPGLLECCLSAGVAGLVCKGEPCSVLVEALRQVGAGVLCIGERPAQCLAEALCGRSLAEPAAKLSEAESRVLALLGEVRATGEIADELCVSPHTVVSYYRRLIGKLGLAGMKELRQHAVRQRVQDASAPGSRGHAGAS